MRAPERGYNVAAGARVPSVPDANINVSQVYDFSDTQSTTGFGKVEYDLTDNVTAYATLGGNKFNFNKRESPGGTITTNSGTVSTLSTAQLGSYETYTGEVGFRAKLATGSIRHEVSVSANRMHQTYRLGQTAYATYLTNIYHPVTLPQQTVPLTASTYGEGPASAVTLQSYAMADTLSFADGLVQLTGGLRRQNVDSQTYAPTTAAITRKYDSSATTPVVGVVVRPTQTLSLVASYIEALTQGPQPPANAINSADAFAPFKTKQYEMGAKADYGTFGRVRASSKLPARSALRTRAREFIAWMANNAIVALSSPALAKLPVAFAPWRRHLPRCEADANGWRHKQRQSRYGRASPAGKSEQ